ncbi:MAG: glycosyltransferase, partial [Melioribacteraceae bacterium]|nr:glycosyltransferase [Melioribacteraceae bacterium]
DSLLDQSYPADLFELIYVNDNSEDDSEEIVKKNMGKGNIRLINSNGSKELSGHKKIAIDSALKIARGEIILTTDADCTHPKEWIESMIQYFTEDTAFVSGPVELENNNSLFNEIQRLEFSSLITAGAGLIGAGIPTICNGANLGFKRSVFNAVNGYEGNLNLSSGDDEFLMQKIHSSTQYIIKFATDSKCLVKTKASDTIADFINQRKRWASKGLFYKNEKLIFSLILIFLFYLGLIVQPVLIYYSSFFLYTFLAGFLLKIVFEYLIMRRSKKNLLPSIDLSWFLIAEIFHVPYIVITSILGIFGGFNWRGRKLRR